MWTYLHTEFYEIVNLAGCDSDVMIIRFIWLVLNNLLWSAGDSFQGGPRPERNH